MDAKQYTYDQIFQYLILNKNNLQRIHLALELYELIKNSNSHHTLYCCYACNFDKIKADQSNYEIETAIYAIKHIRCIK